MIHLKALLFGTAAASLIASIFYGLSLIMTLKIILTTIMVLLGCAIIYAMGMVIIEYLNMEN